MTGVMATRKMTFSLPTALTAQFSARERSQYVAEALAARLRERDEMLVEADEVANPSRQARAIERELDNLEAGIAEPIV